MSDVEVPRPSISVYAGLFFVTLATLMHEILLTRIFSVAMWYHFAFMAISIAMFGMTVGAIIVYLRPSTYTQERVHRHLSTNALLYSLSLVVCFLVFLQIPFVEEPGSGTIALWSVGFVIIGIPFVFSGVTVALALTKFPGHVNRLYAADLIGAALGCVVLIYSLDFAGGATSVLVVGALAALGSVLFAGRAPEHKGRTASAVAFTALSLASIGHGVLERQNHSLIQITDALGNPNSALHYVRWNSHSRVAVSGDPFTPSLAAGWGLSGKTSAQRATIRQMFITIDTFAGTVITHFDGDTRPLWYLTEDVTNMAHHLRHRGDVAVVGVGGGRDVLSALAFNQRSVTGIEINQNVLRAITDVYGDFSGHLDEHPKVSLVNDEARSYLTRSKRRFDIIQLSLIDTFAATAAGAFVLTENSLYTADAWETFLRRLKSRGILTVSRWYYPTRPAEALRLASLAREALTRIGVEEPRKNVLLVKAPIANGIPGKLGSGVANIMVSPSAFSDEDLAAVDAALGDYGFEAIVTPREAPNEDFAKILSTTEAPAFMAQYPLDLTAPTDDRPFFFHMLRLRDFSDSLAANYLDPNRGQLRAIRLLVVLLGIVGALTLLCIVLPLTFATKKGLLKGNGSLLAFFMAIGTGFMFIEISQMQRLMVMLGHPTYALSVVLFTLLVGTGVGSYLSERIGNPWRLSPRAALAVLVGVLSVFGILTPLFVPSLAGAPNIVRIGVAAVSLLTIGLFLGIPFPLGMRAASSRAAELMPWLWGINGAASVLCSVLAAAVALSFGISAAFWAGVACYVGALVTLPRAAAAA